MLSPNKIMMGYAFLGVRFKIKNAKSVAIHVLSHVCLIICLERIA